MKIRTINMPGVRLAVALLGLVGAGSAGAQQQLDTSRLQPDVQAAECAAVDWNKDMLAQYPRIAEGCQEVVTSGDGKWVRFQADYLRSNRDGSVTLEFKDRQGRAMEQLTLLPTQTQRVSIDGQEYRFSELTRGQQLNVYVPERMYGVALAPGVPPEQLALLVPQPAPVAPTQLAQRGPQPAPTAPTQLAQREPQPALTAPTQLAQVQREPAVMAQVLPRTAGPLPLLALAGFLSLLGALILSIRRRHLAAGL
jgi:hypothetical protein